VKFSKNNTSSPKLEGPELSYLVQIVPLGLKLIPPRVSQFYTELYKNNFERLLFLNREWEFGQLEEE